MLSGALGPALRRALAPRFVLLLHLPRIGLPVVSKCCLGRSGPVLSYCFTFRRLSGSGLEVLSGALGPALRRALAPGLVLLLPGCQANAMALCGQAGWLAGWPAGWLAGRLACWLAEWRAGWLAGRKSGKPPGRVRATDLRLV